MLDSSAQNWAQYFIVDEYRDSSGKLNRQYLLTRDGFTLLVMGFTGQKALQWKLKYIEAFNAMEKTLKDKGFQIEPVQLQCIKETNKTLKYIQDKSLRDSIARQALSKLYDIEVPAVEINTKTIGCDITVKEFIAVQCDKEADHSAKLEDLYQCYDAWCRLSSYSPLSKINFGRHMRLYGFEQGHRRGLGRFWRGVKIKQV
jgi:phage regulator Rha-like protein